MNLCKDCKYFYQALATYGDCNHETNLKINYVTGKTFSSMYAQHLRENVNLCGPDAKYFEEATK